LFSTYGNPPYVNESGLPVLPLKAAYDYHIIDFKTEKGKTYTIQLTGTH
jgi:hypothetical protein